MYADIIFDSAILKELPTCTGHACLAVKKQELREEAEKVIENNGRITGISKENSPDQSSEFIGIMKLSKSGAKNMIKQIEKALKTNLNVTLINIINQIILDGEEVTSFNIGDKKFIDIDFPEDLKKAEEVV